jgi:hypothetical protein
VNTPVGSRMNEVLDRWFPGRFARWNGIRWESRDGMWERRVRALEAHVQDLEERYASLENGLNIHAQGQQHRPRKKEVQPDAE